MSTARPHRIRRFVPHVLAIVIAFAGCMGTALWARKQVEMRTIDDVTLSLTQAGHEWAYATADGLMVTMLGTAPDEATRFAALSAVGRVVDASRVIDEMDVEATAAIAPPRFSVEVLRNADGVSLIGLVPTESDPDTIVERARRLSGTAQITDLLESADFAPPPNWEQALAFGLETLELLPRSKVSISAERVAVTAVAVDLDDKRRIERQLNRTAPEGVALALAISAPRPVIAPFTLRFITDGDGAHFDACAADSEAARDTILAAAIDAGLTGEPRCTLGLGTPSTRWGEAAARSIRALGAIGQGSVTLSNADITLIAAEGTPKARFDREIGELEGALPPVFSLNAILTPSVEETDEGEDSAAEFVATLSPEGQVQLRGRVGSEETRMAIESFSEAAFGAGDIVRATRIEDEVPPGWPNRVLAGLAALSELASGVVTVGETALDVTGATGNPDARAEIARLLSDRLPDGAEFTIDVTYSEALDPNAALPTPQECIEQIEVAANAQKISFAPSSSDIEPDALPTIDAIADILRQCSEVPIEIAGHTDSQGREIMNQQLSQARADAVLNAIMDRRVFVSNLRAVGYGETIPIADNGTEEGREANRRIEFNLIQPGQDAPDESAEAEASDEEPAE